MEIVLDHEASEALAFGKAMIDAEGRVMRPASLAHIASLPALTENGRLLQKAGPELLAQMFAKALEKTEIDPGNRLCFPYREIDFEGEKRVLYYRLPYQNGSHTFNPRWNRDELEQPKGGKGKDGSIPLAPIIASKDIDAPYLYHKRRLLTVDIQDGLVQLDNPEMPAQVVDEFEGRTDDLRVVPIRLAPDADHKVLCNFGFHADQASMGRLREAMRAQAGAHAHLDEVYCTAAKGWVRFPGCASAHYVFGDRTIAPAGGPELRAIARGGTGAAAPMGVSTAGTWAGWKRAIALALRNPAIAALSGFSCSSAMFGLNKEMEAGIVHMVGGSSTGKSTALKVCASFVGSAEGPREATAYIQSWNSTENALEAPLSARSDAPSLYDELYELPQNVDVLALLYRVTNGRGKLRMTKEAEARLPRDWKTQVLSTGEGSFASRIAQDGHEFFPGGLQFRVLELHVETIPFWSHVSEEAAKPSHGAYGFLVDESRATAPTAAGRIIEALESSLQRNHGHFWERWIALLQSADGGAEAERWFEQERGALEALIPAGANPIYVRRSKHIAAAMAGLRGVLRICEFGETFDREVLAAAREWAREHLWPAGLSIIGGESGDLHERFQDWLLSREGEFLRVGAPFGPGRPSLGWIERDGGCAIPGADLRKIAAELKIDCGRLEKSMSAHGWEKARKRHPSGGRDSAPQRVWHAKGLFRPSQKNGLPVLEVGEIESAAEAFGA